MKESDFGKKKRIDTTRIRFVASDPSKGVVLADRTKIIGEYLNENTPTEDGFVIVYFKDLGMQVSWTTVFLVEYFGPILITGALYALRDKT